jgi:hypothetical protein
MRYIIWVCFTFPFFSTSAQTIHITGFVKDENGKSISNAMVQIKETKKGTYSDTAGSFTIDVPLNSTLIISHANYKNAELPTAKKTFENVVLTLEADPKAEKTADYTKDVDQYNTRTLQNSVNNPGSNVYGVRMTGLIPSFTHKEDTRGTQYLFDKWVTGAVLNANGEKLGLDYKLNYDKINGNLLATTDFTSALEVDKTQYKTFLLYTEEGDTIEYNLVKNIDPAHYAMLIGAGEDFKTYKLVTTKFEKSDYHTDGIASTGNPYDEYVDATKYFVCNTKINTCQAFSLKKKSILAAFNNDAKVTDYFSKHKEFIDEAAIRNLMDYLNGISDN